MRRIADRIRLGKISWLSRAQQRRVDVSPPRIRNERIVRDTDSVATESPKRHPNQHSIYGGGSKALSLTAGCTTAAPLLHFIRNRNAIINT